MTRIALVPAYFDEHSGAGSELVFGLFDEPFNDGHAVGATVEGESGFVVGDFPGQVGDFGGWDVGGVGDEDVDGSGDGGEEVTLEQVYAVLYAVSGGVFIGELEGVGRDVGGSNDSFRKMERKGNGDGAAARAYVNDVQASFRRLTGGMRIRGRVLRGVRYRGGG